MEMKDCKILIFQTCPLLMLWPGEKQWALTGIPTLCWTPETGQGPRSSSPTPAMGAVSLSLLVFNRNNCNMVNSVWRVWNKTGMESSETSETLGELTQLTRLGSLWLDWYLSVILRLLSDLSVKYRYFLSYKSLKSNGKYKISCREVRATGGDETDAKGVFLKSELRSELRRMHRTELEGRLGLSSHKLDDILDRAEARTSQLYKHTIPQHLANTKGTIHYNAFLGRWNKEKIIFIQTK